MTTHDLTTCTSCPTHDVRYKLGPRGESQPITDHSNDPLTPARIV